MKGFTKQETERLIELAKNCKREGKSLCSVFEKFAIESGRAKGSVRNYYYSLLASAQKGNSQSADFIKGTDLKSEKFELFTPEEEGKLIKNILIKVGEGASIRRAIIEIAKGDEKKILRYQNKYRNLIIKNRPLVESSVVDLKKEGYIVHSPYSDKGKIDDTLIRNKLKSEINSLVDRISFKVKKENVDLKKRIEELEKENFALMQLLDAFPKSKAADYYALNKKSS